MPLVFDSVSFSYETAKKGGKREATNAAAPVLCDVSFTLNTGEIIGVCGPTGSGKTTLLSLANGLLKPTEGTVSIDGNNVNGNGRAKAACRAEVGIVFQYPERQLLCPTVHDDIAFGPRNLGLSATDVETRIQKALELVVLNAEEISDRSPFELSGGQQRRVALAGVLAMQPRILVLDEPTVGLDPRGHKSLIDLLKQLNNDQGLSIIMASHNMDDLAALADRILCLDRKGNVAIDTPAAIFSDKSLLEQTGLEAPFPMRVAHALNTHGFSLPANICTIEELADAIAK